MRLTGRPAFSGSFSSIVKRLEWECIPQTAYFRAKMLRLLRGRAAGRAWSRLLLAGNSIIQMRLAVK